MVYQSRWNNTISCIFWIMEEILESEGMNRKYWERRGFLICAGVIYPIVVPYYKGIHLTIESQCNNRDIDDWKLNKKLILNLKKIVHWEVMTLKMI